MFTLLIIFIFHETRMKTESFQRVQSSLISNIKYVTLKNNFSQK